MRQAPRALLAIGAGFAVSLIAACGGGSGLLSADESNSLSNGLDQVSSAVQSGDCPQVHAATSNLENQVQNLPPDINSTLSTDLSQGVSTVSQLAVTACRTTPTTVSTATKATTTASTATTAPTTNTSTTTTPTTTATTSPATTPSTTGSTSTTSSGGGGLIGAGGTTIPGGG